jgi:hypothetical protein
MSFVYDITQLKNLSIQKCLRGFPKYDIGHIPDNLKDQESDGDIYFVFSNECILKISAITEIFSIGITEQIKIIESNFSDISSNAFWKNRIGKSIFDVEVLSGNSKYPFGVKFKLENSMDFKIEYVSESDYEFDAIVIRDCK